MTSKLRRSIARASVVRTRFGVAGLAREIVDKAILRPASINVLDALVLDSEAARVVPVDGGFELRFLTVEEVAELVGDPANEIEPAFVERARRGRDLCFGAIRDRRVACYAWFALGSIEPEHAAGAALGLPDDTAYVYKGFTPADFRGRGLYPGCLAAGLAALRSRGIERSIAFVHWSNVAAMRACARAGYRRMGRLVVGPFGPLRAPAEARARGIRFGSAAADALAARAEGAPPTRG